MDTYNLVIILMIILITVILAIILYKLYKPEDNSILYFNENIPINLGNSHLNKTLILSGYNYNIYLSEFMKNKNGTIKLVHLEDSMDKFYINYSSNLQIVEYEKNTLDYNPGENPIDGIVHLHPSFKGSFGVHYHTTTIMINKNLTSIHSECMIADGICSS